MVLHRAVGDDRRGDVEHHRRLLARRNRDRDRVGAKQRLRATPHRHVVGARDHRIDPDHALGERERRVDTSGTRMVRAPRADPGHAAFAGERNRGLGRPRHHKVTHSVVAVDQRGRRRGLAHGDRGPRIDPTGPKPAHVLREAEHAVGIGAGKIGLGHQLGDLGSVRPRQAHGAERIRDQAGNRRRRHPRRRRVGLVHFETSRPHISCGHARPKAAAQAAETDSRPRPPFRYNRAPARPLYSRTSPWIPRLSKPARIISPGWRTTRWCAASATMPPTFPWRARRRLTSCAPRTPSPISVRSTLRPPRRSPACSRSSPARTWTRPRSATSRSIRRSLAAAAPSSSSRTGPRS